jgi:glycosyltransferase involved in cell wall biosynthesis
MRAVGRAVYQVNLWEGFGGSEVYTRFLSIALQSLGLRSTVFVNRRARWWRELDFGGADLRACADRRDLLPALPERGALILTNTPLGGRFGEKLKRDHTVVSFAHQPLYRKELAPYAGSALVVANSWHVLKSVRWAELPCYPEPMYGVADIGRLKRPRFGPVTGRSCYAWDRRKLRDRVLGGLEPAWRWMFARGYEKRPGLTLGLVSRLVNMKQFPQLFEILAPIIARHPGVWLEVFGSGGYASVRDLKRSLRPIRGRVRYWGQQEDVRPAYRAIDFLLAGLPEREGMGRNVIEAQFCGTPVLAVRAPPFTETVLDGSSGCLYTDPRRDGGREFERILQQVLQGAERPDPLRARNHLLRYTQAAFNQSLARLLAHPALAAPARAEPPLHRHLIVYQ